MIEFEDSGIDCAAALAPPFHRPLTEAEIAQFILKPGAPAEARLELEIDDGWILSLYSLATPEGRVPNWGWVKGCFALSEEICDNLDFSVLTHLPTGYLIARTAELDTLLEIANLLAPLADWRALNIDGGKGQQFVVRRALKENFYFVVNAIASGGEKIPFWSRETGAREIDL